METPVPRSVTPSSASSPSLLQEVSGTAATQPYQTYQALVDSMDNDENLDQYSGETISVDGLEDQNPPRDEVRQSPPYITQAVRREPVQRPKPTPLRRPAAAARAAPRGRPQLIVNYPDELNYVPEAHRRRHREVSPDLTLGPSRPKKAREDWPPTRVEPEARRPNRSVYDAYDFIDPHPADPRTVHDSDRGQARQARPRKGIPAVLIPTHEAAADHVLYNNSDSNSQASSPARSARPRHELSPSSMSEHYSEQPSRASSRASSAFSRVSSAVSRAPTNGDHPPTRFGGVAPVIARAPARAEVELQDITPVVYGPRPFDCPLDIANLPSTEPMDAESAPVRAKLKTVIDTIYLNPLPKEKLAELYKDYPRPTNIQVLHKTRLNDDVRRALMARSRESVVARDDQLRSLQWSLQFAARPILQLLDHVSDGNVTLDPKYVVRKAVDSLKLIAKASWKQNDARRYNVYAGLKGTGLEVAQEHQNHTNFEFLLGTNPREQIAARQKEDETLRDVVAGPRPGGNKPRQGNSRGGQARGRHNNNQGGRQQQSRGHHRSRHGDRSRQSNGQPQQNSSSHRHKSGGRGRQRGRGQSNPNRGQSSAK